MDLSNKGLLVDESLFSTANGYIGVRGNFEEGYPNGFDSIRGTYINGFYDEVAIAYGENAYGFPQTAQKMLNVPDVQTITFEVDGDIFSAFEGVLHDQSRELDMANGLSVRKIEWQSPKGHRLNFTFTRMASFQRLELFVISVLIESITYEGPIKVVSTLNGQVSNYVNPKDPRVASGHSHLLHLKSIEKTNDLGLVSCQTTRSNLSLQVAVTHDLIMSYDETDWGVKAETTLEIKKGQSQTLRKFSVFTDTIRHQDLGEEGISLLKAAKEAGYDTLLKEQRTYLDQFWTFSQVKVEGEPDVEKAIHYNTYQLLASAGKDPHSNIPAKGLSGEGYEGHYFWDTEIYMLPLFTLTFPDVAKNLLRFRHATLDMARERALEMGHTKGAKIPWRTIKGSECSAYFPAGSAQYHINADVGYAHLQYYLMTGDVDFMLNYGFEVVYETARLWLDMGHYGQDQMFRIDAVTGPDEYTAIVNNNYYTNAMAKYHMQGAVTLYDDLNRVNPQRMLELTQALSLSDEEHKAMLEASTRMFLPYSETLGIHLQDDSFEHKKEWDFANTPPENYPLLLHYHPLTIYRHKVLKQADTVLAHFLLDDAPLEVIKASYDYYERLTTHDSSLSPCVYGMMASRINDPEKAYMYLKKSLMLDLENLHGNTKDGLHIANAGGAYMAMVYGFGGLRIKKNGLHLRPTKPKQWASYRFNINFKGRQLQVIVGQNLTLKCEVPVSVWVDGQLVHVHQTVEVAYSGKH